MPFEFDLEDPMAEYQPQMAPPPEIWQGSPAADINAANAGAPLNRVYATGQNNAYTAEQAAAAPYHEQIALYGQRLKAEEDAIRYQGQREFQDLVNAGATPEEALRRTAGKLFFNHPDKMASALDRIPGPANIPKSIAATPLMGPGGEQLGFSVVDPVSGAVRSTQFAGAPKPPLDVVASQRMLQGGIGDLRQELEAARKEALIDPTGDAAKLVPTLTAQLQQAEQAYVRGSTNWMNPKGIQAPTEQLIQQPAELPQVMSQAQYDQLSAGTKYMGKNGRIYRKP